MVVHVTQEFDIRLVAKMFAENVWAEMKVVKQPQIYHLKPFSFSTRSQDLKWNQTFFLCFSKDSSFLKYKPALALASGYDRSKKKNVP